MSDRARPLRDLLFPPRCSICGTLIRKKTVSRVMCTACYPVYQAEIDRGCAVCGKPYSHCICRPEGFIPDDLIFALPYNKLDGVCRKLILSCKNRKNTDGINELSRATVSAAEKRGILGKELVLTYVPRAPEKEVHTGVDPAAELAKAIAKRLKRPLHHLLGHRPLRNEQKGLPYPMRGPIAEETYFRLPGVKATVTGKTVLLIDDVVTSGATAGACAKLLKEAGADQVICLAAAKSIDSYREFMRYEAPPSRKPSQP
ncbi:MAG: ComF family protein [Clostridia bacterium]|nr:ComF family protein [Clostridia bacterium]